LRYAVPRVTTLTLRAGDTTIACRLRRSQRARRLRITVGPTGVEVVAPARTAEVDIRDFLARYQGWIAQKTSALRRTLDAHPGASGLVNGGQVLLRGAPATLTIVPSAAARAEVTAQDGLRVCLPERVPDSECEGVVETALQRWLRRQAQTDAEAHAARHGSAHGLVPQAIRVKQQRHLWGSCTSRGVVNLNWRLIFAPPEVFEYVVVHELCHLRVRNHQPEFWRLVAEVLPGYAPHRRWLRDHGHLLTLRPGRI
jgi:predicted metal-dependent hydrolase